MKANGRSRVGEKAKAGTKGKATAPVVQDKSNVLTIDGRQGISEARQLADLATDGIAINAMTARYFLGTSQPGLAITDMVNSLKDHGQRVNRNDLAALEQMLTAQSVSLNSIYSECARRSALNMGQYPDVMERYLRLGLKAQAQCRATVETLAAIKNPPVVFAKQANITNGPQQVNNGVMSPPKGDETQPPHAAENQFQQSKLLEDGRDGSTYMDSGSAPAAAGGDSTVEAVGAVNRTEELTRKSKSGS